MAKEIDLDALELPRTPAEAKRHWMIDRLWVGSLITSVGLIALCLVIWLGPWPDRLAPNRLHYLGLLATILAARLFVFDLSFALGGPVGRWKARWGDRELSADDDDAIDKAYDSGSAGRLT